MKPVVPETTYPHDNDYGGMTLPESHEYSWTCMCTCVRIHIHKSVSTHMYLQTCTHVHICMCAINKQQANVYAHGNEFMCMYIIYPYACTSTKMMSVHRVAKEKVRMMRTAQRKKKEKKKKE